MRVERKALPETRSFEDERRVEGGGVGGPNDQGRGSGGSGGVVMDRVVRVGRRRRMEEERGREGRRVKMVNL